MISISIFENSFVIQLQRLLIALAILILGNLAYLYLTRNFNHFVKNKMSYLGIWITMAFVFGVCVVKDSKDVKQDYVIFGLLIALLIYVPVFGFLKSVGNVTGAQFAYFSTFGIIIGTLASLFTYLISVKTGLLENKTISD